MPHFFISSKDVNKDTISISDKENYHHIAKVMRAKTGENLLLVDENRIQYNVVIKNIDSQSITTKVVETKKSENYLKLNLVLMQSVLKTEAQSLVIQKATELGVKKIIPFISDNSVIKHDVACQKTSKWQKIANEAVKQCERVDFPIVSKTHTYKEIVEDKDCNIKIACVERANTESLKACLQKINLTPKSQIAVIIGPEGGFSAKELNMLEENKEIHKVSLGKLILRAETAVITALSNVIYELEND